MKIYTDIDYVMHDYEISFLRALKSIHNREFKQIDMLQDKVVTDSHLSLYEKEYGLTTDQIWEAVYLANTYKEWHPCSFSGHLVEFLKGMVENGHEVLAITARESRRGAEAITKSAFRYSIPVITANTENKKYAIEDNSIFFDDSSIAVNEVLREKNDVVCIVPSWPWNLESLVDHDLCYRASHEDLRNIEKIIERLGKEKWQIHLLKDLEKSKKNQKKTALVIQ